MTTRDEHDWLAERFEAHRTHLRGVAYRMLGSVSEADDAVQEAWLRVSRADTTAVENLGGWLTTLVARVSLDMLRSRNARREEALGAQPALANAAMARQPDPEHDAILADSVGLALLVVLERLNPAERLAFVLHDMFGVPFEEIAEIVGRSPAAARQLASRARRRVQGVPAAPNADLAHQRKVVDAFVAALRAGDFEALLEVLDPDLVVRVDEAGARAGSPREVRGATEWAKGAVEFSRRARLMQPAVVLVDGKVGAAWAPGGRIVRLLRFRFVGERIAGIDVIADPAQLAGLELSVLDA